MNKRRKKVFRKRRKMPFNKVVGDKGRRKVLRREND